MVSFFSAKCIDSYTAKRRSEAESEKIDPRQEDIVDRMFGRCFEDGQFKQALGIAVETKRMDMFRKSIQVSVSSLPIPLCLQCLYIRNNLVYNEKLLLVKHWKRYYKKLIHTPAKQFATFPKYRRSIFVLTEIGNAK